MSAVNDALKLVRQRRSVRTFDGRALSEEDRKRMLDCLEHASNPYDIPISWFLLSASKDSLVSKVIVGADTFAAGKMKQVPHAEEAFGYSFEKAVLYAQSIGIGTTWIAGTMDRPAFERAIDLAEGEVMPCVSPLGYPAQKMSLRESLMRKGIKADTRLAPEELFFAGSPSNPMRPADMGELADVLEMVRWAPSAVNKQPWRLILNGDKVYFYEKRSKGYVSENGWDLQKIDLGIAMYHFEYGAAALGKKTELIPEDPGIEGTEELVYAAGFRIF